jgi:hypothetical protein
MRGAEQGWFLKAEWDGYSDGLCRRAPRLVARSRLRREGRIAFREPLQIIVMSVIGVISLYLKGFHMTVPK